MMHIVCCVRDGDRVFGAYRTTRRGVEAMDHSYALMDPTVYGRQEPWEDSPPGRPTVLGTPVDAVRLRSDGRPVLQWSRIEAGRSDALTPRLTLRPGPEPPGPRPSPGRVTGETPFG